MTDSEQFERMPDGRYIAIHDVRQQMKGVWTLDDLDDGWRPMTKADTDRQVELLTNDVMQKLLEERFSEQIAVADTN